MVGFMLSFIVPKITDIFTQINQELPTSTKIVIKLGDLRSSKWIIARHSKCFGQVDEKLWKAQTDIARMDDHIRFFIGPDTNSLGDEYRFDTCHLNQQGQEKMATLWLESLKNAKKNENAFRKETMLNIFSKISF